MIRTLNMLPANMAAAADGVTMHRSNGWDAADSLRMQSSNADSDLELTALLLLPLPAERETEERLAYERRGHALPMNAS